MKDKNITDSKLIPATILKRYKRFLADCRLDNGEIITSHCANTGAMTSCWEPGWKVLLSYHDSPTRKLKYSLEMTHNGKSWINVNTSRTNKLVHSALEDKQIVELREYDLITPEYKIGQSRLDFMLDSSDKNISPCFIEVKNVTLKGDDDLALFPDAVSERGQKHLRELINLKKQGYRAVMFYLIAREDVEAFMAADQIDPKYTELLIEAYNLGVEILPYKCKLSSEQISIDQRIPFFY